MNIPQFPHFSMTGCGKFIKQEQDKSCDCGEICSCEKCKHKNTSGPPKGEPLEVTPLDQKP